MQTVSIHAGSRVSICSRVRIGMQPTCKSNNVSYPLARSQLSEIFSVQPVCQIYPLSTVPAPLSDISLYMAASVWSLFQT